MEYNIEFTTTITVEEEDEDAAVLKAQKELAPDGTVDIGQFYIYCNNRTYN